MKVRDHDSRLSLCMVLGFNQGAGIIERGKKAEKMGRLSTHVPWTLRTNVPCCTSFRLLWTTVNLGCWTHLSPEYVSPLHTAMPGGGHVKNK